MDKIIIAHRGNLTGPHKMLENNPDYVEAALNIGFDAEIDLWLLNGKFYLGHDEPTYIVPQIWLMYPGLWCHCKNGEAYLLGIMLGLNVFMHDQEPYALTGQGFVWNKEHPKGIILSPELWGKPFEKQDLSKAYGVCTDYAAIYK